MTETTEKVRRETAELGSLAAITNLLNGIDGESEFVAISKNGDVSIIKNKSGRFKFLDRSLFNLFRGIKEIRYIGSTSIARSPVTQAIKNWSGFGKEQDRVKKRETRRERVKKINDKSLVGTVDIHLSLSEHPKKFRVSGRYYDYKVYEADNGYQKWIEIDRKVKDRMVPTTGRVSFVVIDGERHKISIPAGQFVKKIII